MDDDVKSQLIWATTLVLVVSSIAWAISSYFTITTKAAMENGYVKQTLPGAAGTHWVKKDE